MAPSEPELERWDLYPFGERSPSKIWDVVADHPAWAPPPAQIAPQFLPAYQVRGDRLLTSFLSSVWGYRTSATGIRVAAYLFARVRETAAGRSIRVLRCLTYEKGATFLYRRIRWYLIGAGMIHRCSRIEWEILDPPGVAVPATFDLVGPCVEPGLRSFLAGRGFQPGERWEYRQGPAVFGGSPLRGASRLSRVRREWGDYARRHFAPLLPEPVPSLDPSVLGRFLPGGGRGSLFLPFGRGPVGQWCPDLAPLVGCRGRWEQARFQVKRLRLLRFLPGRSPAPPTGRPCLLPESAKRLFPRATTLQIGPLPQTDGEAAEWWESAGYSRFATLTLMSHPL